MNTTEDIKKFGLTSVLLAPGVNLRVEDSNGECLYDTELPYFSLPIGQETRVLDALCRATVLDVYYGARGQVVAVVD